MARTPDESDLLFVPAGVDRSDVPADIGLSPPRFFPPPTATTPEGLLCIGGQFLPEWLLDAYRHGIFPWPMWEDEPIVWWSPDPRAIIELDGLRVSQRLRRTLYSKKFTVTCDRAFGDVIQGCATGHGREEGTWLTPAMIDAYCDMHRLGHAHSVEVWYEEDFGLPDVAPNPQSAIRNPQFLAGGIYGIAIGGLFAAESMFHRVRDASKVALVRLVQHLRSRGYKLLDIQQWTPHTGRLGAIEIPRLEYLRRLASAVEVPVTFGHALENGGVVH
jgi:leucyl/phenylalanyl-tRNA--protein transferase